MDAAHPRSVQPVSFYSDTITLLSSCSILGIGEYKCRDAAPVSRGRRFLRGLEGHCFDRIMDEQGDEIRVQLEVQECSF